MATTRLMPLHVGKGKNISTALGRTVDYIENPNKTNDGELISSYECDPQIAEQQFLFTKSQYTRLTGRNQGDRDVIAYHLRQSFKPDEITAEKANKIGYDLAMSLTKGKHAFIVCTHVDKAHIHSHIVFNSTALDATKKFRNFWNSSFAIRKISDKLCIENGVSIIDNPKKAKGNYATWLGEKPLTFSDKLRLAIDEVLETKPTSFDEFLKQMQAKGFEFKDGKHIAFKGAGQKKFIRLKSLGEDYAEDKIKAVIGGVAVHIPRPKAKVKQDKVNLLIDIQSKINAGKGKGYENWAKVFNAKQKANTLYFLRQNNFDSLDEFNSKVDDISKKYDYFTTNIKVLESQIKDKSEMRKHIINYLNSKAKYSEYKQSGYSKKLAEEYHTEIALYKASQKYFNDKSLKKLPNIKSLNDDLDRLYKEKNSAYNDYKKLKKEYQEIQIVKSNIDRILGEDTKINTKKKSQDER